MSFTTPATLTDEALARWNTVEPQRLAEIVTAGIRHLHAFAREVRLSHDEWLAGMRFLTEVGQISNDKRQEMILLSDVLGLSMLVVMNEGDKPGATPDTVLGPFFIDGSPDMADGADMAAGIDGEPVLLSGQVRDSLGAPIAGAAIDVWQSDGDGVYEEQFGGEEPRLRGVYRTDADGRYRIRTILPLGYTIPMDGPVGRLIGRSAISPYRPAHIHFRVTAPGCRTLITHIFPEATEYLASDVVFGAREALVVPFHRRQPGNAGDHDGGAPNRPYRSATFDIALAPAA